MSETRRILVTDDDPAIRELLCECLSADGYQVEEAADGATTLRRALAETPDLLLLDVRLPDADGLDVLRELQDARPQLPVIVITGHGTGSVAIQAMQAGAYDYLTKPFELDEVVITVARFFEHHELASQVRLLQEELAERGIQERIVGQSAPMQEIYKVVGRVSGSDATVLIVGETGTGKELVAQTLHENSRRRQGPLIKVNCAALPETLLESELFGHEKGAFTGAINQRKGRFELAHGGTMFLDEIGEMSPNTQKRLLRVLQEGEFERVGGNRTIKVEVRVIAATNKDLEYEVSEGRFREDLYYRLNVIRLSMPPLRERLEDIPLLVAHFLDKYRYRPDAPPTRISEEALQLLQEYTWPGNVRELENAIERAVVMSQGQIITSDHLTLGTLNERTGRIDLADEVRRGVKLSEVLQKVERMLISEALQQEGDEEAAARALGLSLDDFQKRRAIVDASDLTDGRDGSVRSPAPTNRRVRKASR